MRSQQKIAVRLPLADRHRHTIRRTIDVDPSKEIFELRPHFADGHRWLAGSGDNDPLWLDWRYDLPPSTNNEHKLVEHDASGQLRSFTRYRQTHEHLDNSGKKYDDEVANS